MVDINIENIMIKDYVGNIVLFRDKILDFVDLFF